MWLGKVTSGSEEEDTIIGPMPAKGPVESDVTKEFERRAQRMKEKLTSADSPVPRQSWMSELPPGLKSVGFGPRTVRRGADDKSGIGCIWTDTPADRERQAKDNEGTVLSGRDERLAEQVTPYNESKRPESPGHASEKAEEQSIRRANLRREGRLTESRISKLINLMKHKKRSPCICIS
ncbi:GPALPP motifs-containing protein 1-like isoform X2 [Aythya fuligula]|uniref:GPALPP motifs-containing protein 1-like isoform X2 n=1 Tax=Aythya fuligula TaxID=219594 RepID=A0A6J3CFX7_AYTFU|nr:GPALPP motifs-containing protein 1-like isoform X2 [Aythya fuligula]